MCWSSKRVPKAIVCFFDTFNKKPWNWEWLFQSIWRGVVYDILTNFLQIKTLVHVEWITAVLTNQTASKSIHGKPRYYFLNIKYGAGEALSWLFHSVHGHGPRRCGILPLTGRHDCSPRRRAAANGATMGVRTLAPTVLRGRRHTALWLFATLAPPIWTWDHCWNSAVLVLTVSTDWYVISIHITRSYVLLLLSSLPPPPPPLPSVLSSITVCHLHILIYDNLNEIIRYHNKI